MAVPCWSSCMTGQSRASITRRSISKQRGAEMSSRLTAPKLGRRRIRVSTISSGGSLVSRTMGIELSPAKLRNRADLPSMTGSDARGPMSPRPSTADPSLTTATRRSVQVYLFTRVASVSIARDTWATPGGVGDRQVALGVDRRAQLDGQLAAGVRQEDLVVGDRQIGNGRFGDRGVAHTCVPPMRVSSVLVTVGSS